MINYTREVAYRVFSNELRAAEVVERKDEEWAPQYVRLPSGHEINRVFVVGILIDAEDVGEDMPFWKMKVSDPHGTFDCAVGQYSPDHAQTSVEYLEPPVYVAIVGKVKAREYNDKVYFSIAVESITKSDEATYKMWCAETEEQTAGRQEAHTDV